MVKKIMLPSSIIHHPYTCTSHTGSLLSSIDFQAIIVNKRKGEYSLIPGEQRI